MGFFFKLLLKAGVTLGVMFIGYQYMLGGGMGGVDLQGMLSGISKSAPAKMGELGNAVIKQDVTIYQWTDKHGVTHFGGTAPVGQGHYDKKVIKGNTNVMNAVKTPESEETTTQPSRVTSLGNLYTPGGIKNAIDSTKDVSKQANDHMAEQEKILQDILGGKNNGR